MKDMIEASGAGDDIDRIVNTLIEDPTQAETVKSALRDKLAPAQQAPSPTALPMSDDDDPEEFWDNFPV